MNTLALRLCAAGALLSLAGCSLNLNLDLLGTDTPGGEVTASDMIYHEILNFKKKTGATVTALMMSLAASGGYYIACAADRIIAHPTTLTGSIGVIALFPETAVLLDKLGLRMNVIKSGALKDAGSLFREMTDGDYRVFLEVVADGRVYSGRQALELKLVDALGYFDDALRATLEAAGIRAARVIAYTRFPKSRTNIYAASRQAEALWEPGDWTRGLSALKSGRYCLWLPPAFRP